MTIEIVSKEKIIYLSRYYITAARILMKTLSIIIPIFNEEKYIVKTLTKVLKANTLGLKKELILIDDGSTDSTQQVVLDFLKRNKKLKKGVKLYYKEKNLGKGAAIKSGLLKSKGDIVLIQDSDLEYSPDDYVSLLDPFFKADADVVYGSRMISDRPHRVLYFWHYFFNFFLTTFSNMLTNLNLTDMETGYKVFRGDLIRDLAPKLKSKRFGFEPEITARISKIKGLVLYEVGISYWGRTYEEGKKINWTDGLRALWEIIKFNLLSKN